MIHIQFNIEYKTQWGEELCIVGSCKELGNYNEEKALTLTTQDGVMWYGSVELETTDNDSLSYSYFVRKDNQVTTREENPQRILILSNQAKYNIFDHWKNKLPDNYLYTSAFTNAVFKREYKENASPKKAQSLVLNVICPFVKKNEHLVIAGEGNALGNWDLKKALPLKATRFGEWQIELNINELKLNGAYKFVITHDFDLQNVYWEDRPNRHFRVYEKSEYEQIVNVEMGLVFNYPSFRWKGKGVAIPLFSLRSDNSAGVGDFLDLKKMVDWAYKTHQDIIQILPINDTNSSGSWKDSYPYSSISIFALNPIYIAISEFTLSNNKKNRAFLAKAKELNKLESLDYERVYSLKYDFLKDLFIEKGNNIMQSDAYVYFYEKNKEWLFPYICFCFLRDTYQTSDYSQWDVYSIYRQNILERMRVLDNHARKEMDFYAFMQFIAHQQLSRVKEYANDKGVALKGDIPIGIDKHSVDAWTQPELFNLDMQSGAPPDDFSVVGQNWGFPTYNWERMKSNDFDWWKRRFSKMSDYFDAYRIDHILGFFRIWEISTQHVQSLLGHFSPALPLSEGEIVHQWRFPFKKEKMVKPFIHKDMLFSIFGEFSDEVQENYLEIIAANRFQLKQFCDTQQKINQHFENCVDSKSISIRDGLFALCAEVLFVSDPYTEKAYHPRISAQSTYAYRELSSEEKEAFNNMYNDFFYKRHNQFWYKHAMQKLPHLVSATSMLVCGEDLGMVPACVDWVMEELQILSLEIQRMPKEQNTLFSNLAEIPYLSVNATSTHDMSTIREWWIENKEISQFYYNHILGNDGDAPDECSAELCGQIVKKHLASPSMWSILPWQDWMSIDEDLRRKDPKEERINDPSNSHQYWRYRMHLSLDKLLKENELNDKIIGLTRL